MQSLPVSTIAHLIQLAIAPVFLLAGIGAILNVLAARLARIVDRSRKLEEEIGGYDPAAREGASAELCLLDRRMVIVNQAIRSCTASALFTCLVVAILFVADLTDFQYALPIALLFIVAMLLLITGLILFLYEISLAMRAIRARRALLMKH